jgi:putative phosphonate metabolism protein
MDQGPRYAIYFVPAADSALYRFGSSILGYDAYTGEAVSHPEEDAGGAGSWRSLTEEPRRYGFHATLKAPFHLSPGCTEAQLVQAVQNFAASGRAIPAIAPVIQTLGGFVALVPSQTDAATDRLAADCTTVFDSFRAALSPEERARRMVGLSPAQIENLDRWGYPHVFAQFQFHMTLTGRVAADLRETVVYSLRQIFGRTCGHRPIPIDRLALLKQDTSQAAFRISSHAQLRPAH